MAPSVWGIGRSCQNKQITFIFCAVQIVIASLSSLTQCQHTSSLPQVQHTYLSHTYSFHLDTRSFTLHKAGICFIPSSCTVPHPPHISHELLHAITNIFRHGLRVCRRPPEVRARVTVRVYVRIRVRV